MGSWKLGSSSRSASSTWASSAWASSAVRLVVADEENGGPIADRDEFEPIGIVIAGPSRAEPAAPVLAYVWGPAPELGIDELAEQRAA